jgi:DNA-binding CsgD family transcriptional regulator
VINGAIAFFECVATTHTDTRLKFRLRQPRDDRRQRHARRKLIVDEAQELSLLIGDIYDASLDRALWPDAFTRIRDFLGACAASLTTQSAITKAVDVHFMVGHEQRFLEQYRETYFKINPIFPTVMFFDLEQDYVLNDVLPRNEFCRTRFAKEWIMPQGLVDGVLSTIEKSPVDCTVFLAMRSLSQGFADDEIRQRFSLILPHIRRALLIGKVIETHQVKAAALADSLDALASAMFIVDGTGRIVHANTSGNLMVSEANVLRAPNGRLHAFDAGADQALLDVFTAASGGDAALGRQGVAVPITARNDERYVAHVLPLTSAGRRRAGVSYGAVAAVFVRKAALDLPLPPVVIAKQFGLTQAELRVLFSVVEIGGVSEVAEVLGIAEATVKTHLQHVFEKTGTSRQADLVKLVAGYCLVP